MREKDLDEQKTDRENGLNMFFVYTYTNIDYNCIVVWLIEKKVKMQTTTCAFTLRAHGDRRKKRRNT